MRRKNFIYSTVLNGSSVLTDVRIAKLQPASNNGVSKIRFTGSGRKIWLFSWEFRCKRFECFVSSFSYLKAVYSKGMQCAQGLLDPECQCSSQIWVRQSRVEKIFFPLIGGNMGRSLFFGVNSWYIISTNFDTHFQNLDISRVFTKSHKIRIQNSFL